MNSYRISVLCVCVAGAGAAGWAGPKKASPRLRLLGGSFSLQAALDAAGRVALQQLESEECQRVLSDFTDARGRTLKQNLDEFGQSAPEYLLQTVRFADGNAYTRRCQDRGIAAITEPGSHVVLVCEVQLRRFANENPRFAGAVIIHETLHTLGLPENPPSAEEITDRVLARCK